jgi:hypothetical protein
MTRLWWSRLRRELPTAAQRRMLLVGAVLSLFAILVGALAYTTGQPRPAQTTNGQQSGSSTCLAVPDDAHPCAYRYSVADLRLVGASRSGGPCPLHPGDTVLVVWAAYPNNHAYPNVSPRSVELQLLLFGPFVSLDAENQFGHALGKSWMFPAGWPRTGWLVQHAWPQPPVVATSPLDTDTPSNLIVISRMTVPPGVPPGVYWLIDREDGLHGGGNGGGARCQMEPLAT